ncbi:hypothetical protein BW897_24785 [Bacillus cereus]|uniref:Uncharacterized protein n=1 Tax=Bacillus cereus TaxID=1396 RepID=A0A1S9TK74_BACCE|nr:hypothetical protein [Bacillus cereus]OOR09981.1 hypothetical protein BW897_24785 [Bacillus cereus]
MSLIEQVRQICNRLAEHGWRDLFLQHGLDIAADDLKTELLKELPNINRQIKGFEDFAKEGKRGIEPGQPARSLFYHALASPNVIVGANNLELTTFPTLAEIETVENYVYGINPPSISELYSRISDNSDNLELGIVVFAYEYRPAPDTVHRKHADMCFSRSGIARVGTMQPFYDPQQRGFLPITEEDSDFTFRVLPARYSAYLSVKRMGNENEFGPLRFRNENAVFPFEDVEKNKSDKERTFWVPLHKLFSGSECLCHDNGEPIDIQLSLKAHHVNEKAKRIYQTLSKLPNDIGKSYLKDNLDKPPFSFQDGIAEFSDDRSVGSNILVPIPHSRLVEEAQYDDGKPLTLNVPKSNTQDVENGIYINTFSSSLLIHMKKNDDIFGRPAPEYVYVRHRLGKNPNLNDEKDMMSIIKKGGYDAVLYKDYTGDGWIEAKGAELIDPKSGKPLAHYAAYSMITAPDFFLNSDQRELMNWYDQQSERLRELTWEVPPFTLSDNRIAVNLELKSDNNTNSAIFNENDDTMTAIISLPYQKAPELTKLDVPLGSRHSYLPDAASGIFAPGWDVSFDRTKSGKQFLAAYGLGSPFPEDSKLCAALSTFWPAVAPDAARTFESTEIEPWWPTVSPLTDEEVGIKGNIPWDGVKGPQIKEDNVVEYPAMEYVDYVQNALDNKFSLSLTGRTDLQEYKERLLSMAFVYYTLGGNKTDWSVLSFQKISSPIDNEELKIAYREAENSLPVDNEELKTAYRKAENSLLDSVYRFEMFRKGNKQTSEDYKKVSVEMKEPTIMFVGITDVTIVPKKKNKANILLKKMNDEPDGNWEYRNVEL